MHEMNGTRLPRLRCEQEAQTLEAAVDLNLVEDVNQEELAF